MKKIAISAAGAAVLAGCLSLPSVGPDYEAPEADLPAVAMPDAGFPTTNLSATCEYVAAAGEADRRVGISQAELAQWA